MFFCDNVCTLHLHTHTFLSDWLSNVSFHSDQWSSFFLLFYKIKWTEMSRLGHPELCFSVLYLHTLSLLWPSFCLCGFISKFINAQRSSTAVPGNKMNTSVPAVLRCSIFLDSSAGEKVFGCPPNASSWMRSVYRTEESVVKGGN